MSSLWRSVALLYYCVALHLLVEATPGSAPWESVAIGGGGYVLQTFFHPLTPHVYMKTDVGGMYRREISPASPDGFKWIPLLDSFGPNNKSVYSVSAIALDPHSGASLFVMSGGYWAYSGCTILKSIDAGNTWKVAQLSWGLNCGGNEGDRAVGNRMAVHPVDSNIVAIGGSDGSVWLTTDGFQSSMPTRVRLPSPAPTNACDPQKNSSCVVRTVMWLPPADDGVVLLIASVPDLGLFASAGPNYTDTRTWSFVLESNMPSTINRLVYVNTSVWATCHSGGVWKGKIVATTTSTNTTYKAIWEVSGALANAQVPFSGIAVRDNGLDVVVMSLLTNSNQSIWRSLNAGRTFARLNWTCTSSVPWWGHNDYNTDLNAGSSLSFDPFSTTPTLWATDFFGVYHAPAPTSATLLAFTNVETGHEEVVVNVVKAPAVGDLLSGAADVGGWRHDGGIATWPSATFKAADGWAHNCLFSIDSTLSLAPDGKSMDAVWVTAGDEYGSCHGSPSWCGRHSWVGVSRDGGTTFTDTTWDDTYAIDVANPYRVAVHPFDGAKAIVASIKGQPVTFTSDFGKTWGNSTGGVVSVGQQGDFWFGQPLATENQIDVNATEATFYYYNGTTTLFVSTDSGASFKSVYTMFPSWNTPFFALATPPRDAAAVGDVWAFAGWKLYHSVNGGANFSQVWEFYHVDTIIAVGAVPQLRSPVSGRDERELSQLCGQRAAADAKVLGHPELPLPPPTRSGAPASYVVYALGERNYGQPSALFASIDFGHSFFQLSGGNATASQGLGDSPTVLEASAKDVGVIYVGTGGRGVFSRNVTAELMNALLACEQ
eukprot:m.155105 g.155105  ORF g.155105 m.155105 type:complete len:827 (+) comp30924_c0_seq6:1734-4214(+)